MINSKKVKCLKVFIFFLVLGILSPGGVKAEEKNEILIGTPLPLTGVYAKNGVEQKWGYEQAVADVNKAGGIFVKEYGRKLPIKLIITDDQSSPDKAVAAVERFIKIDKVDLLLSGAFAPLVVAECQTAEKYKKYMHATVCWGAQWLPNKFKYSSDFFSGPDKMAEVPFEILNSIPAAERPQRIGLFLMDASDRTVFRASFLKAAKKFGYTFAVDESFPIGANDLSSQILKAKAAKIDAAFLFAITPDCVTFVRQLKESGMNIPYIHGWAGTWPIDFWEALGQDAQYIIMDGFWAEELPYPGAEELGKRFRKSFGIRSVSVGLYYANCQILWEAIEKAGTLNSAEIAQKVRGSTFKGTVMGDVTFDNNGYAAFTSTACQWWNGEQRMFYPFVEGAWKFKLAPPWDER